MEKTPTHYFVYVGHQTATKNKLQKEFQHYLFSLESTLITADKLDILKENLIAASVELNEKYPRCTPLKVEINKMHFDKGFMISGFYSIVFQILKAYERH